MPGGMTEMEMRNISGLEIRTDTPVNAELMEIASILR
jgi:hypothetical protein